MTRWTADEWEQARSRLFHRCGLRCEGCGRDLRGQAAVHHRRLRSQGGQDSDDNLMVLHPACHTWAHAHPERARELGWIVPSHALPEDVPVVRSPGPNLP